MRSWGWQVSLLVLARDCFILAALIEFFYLLLSSSKSSLQSKHRYAWKWIKEKVGACFKWGLLKETHPLAILNRLSLAGWEARSASLLHQQRRDAQRPKHPKSCEARAVLGTGHGSSCVQQELHLGAGACPDPPAPAQASCSNSGAQGCQSSTSPSPPASDFCLQGQPIAMVQQREDYGGLHRAGFVLLKKKEKLKNKEK